MKWENQTLYQEIFKLIQEKLEKLKNAFFKKCHIHLSETNIKININYKN